MNHGLDAYILYVLAGKIYIFVSFYLDMCMCAFTFLCVQFCVFECEKHAHPLNVELHVLLGTALDLLLHFPHQRLHVYNAFLGDAGGDSWEDGV